MGSYGSYYSSDPYGSGGSELSYYDEEEPDNIAEFQINERVERAN